MVRLLAVVLLLASPAAFAEEGAPDSVDSTEQFEAAPSRSVEKYGVDTTGPGFRTVRFGLELVGGAVTGLAVATGVTLLTCATAPADGWCVLSGIVLGGGLGMAVGFPLGTWAVGYLLDGTGSFWATLGAAVVGTVAGVYLVSTGNGYAQLAGLAAPLVFSAIAYELTSWRSRSDVEASRASWALVPAIGPKSTGLAFAMTF